LDEGHYHRHPEMKLNLYFLIYHSYSYKNLMTRMTTYVPPSVVAAGKYFALYITITPSNGFISNVMLKLIIEEVALTSNVPRSKIQDPKFKTV
jgi:hypothetical protein